MYLIILNSASIDPWQNYNLNNCKFAFPIDVGKFLAITMYRCRLRWLPRIDGQHLTSILALTDLESGTTKYEQARAKMNMPGDYSIKQLLVDMSSESWI